MTSSPDMPNATPPGIRPEGTSTVSKDQWIFFGIVGAGLLFIALVTVMSIVRTQRAAAVEQAIRASAPEAREALPERQLIDFTLTERSGRTIRRADFDGKFLVVNFVFTGCSISCLAVNHRMAEIQKATAGQADVHLVSLTVDPDSDSPEQLTKFATQFNADSNRWLFLTGEKRVLYPLLEQSFLVQRDQRLLGFVPGGFSHTDRIAVVDARGRLRGLINGLKSSAPTEVLALLAKVRAEPPAR